MKTFENHVDLEIRRVLTKKNGTQALRTIQSSHHQDYWLEIYNDFGNGAEKPRLEQDLINYLERYEESNKPHFSFWAVFNDLNDLSEDQFQLKKYKELSVLQHENSNQYSLNGHSLFVVGLHPFSPRRSKRFPWPALVFNKFEHVDLNAEIENGLSPIVHLYSDRWNYLKKAQSI